MQLLTMTIGQPLASVIQHDGPRLDGCLHLVHTAAEHPPVDQHGQFLGRHVHNGRSGFEFSGRVAGSEGEHGPGDEQCQNRFHDEILVQGTGGGCSPRRRGSISAIVRESQFVRQIPESHAAADGRFGDVFHSAGVLRLLAQDSVPRPGARYFTTTCRRGEWLMPRPSPPRAGFRCGRTWARARQGLGGALGVDRAAGQFVWAGRRGR